MRWTPYRPVMVVDILPLGVELELISSCSMCLLILLKNNAFSHNIEGSGPERYISIISRVQDQKGISQLYNMLEIYHSGPEPLNYIVDAQQCVPFPALL